MDFPTKIEEIQHRLQNINPLDYAATRNYADGTLTYLSPYISRGVITTRMVYDHLISLGFPWSRIEKLIQELCWRDYWQQVWVTKGRQIFADLKHEQAPVAHWGIPESILRASTGIVAVDQAVRNLYETGYMHNHMRMFVASLCCNLAHSHWLAPAKWMYSHLLDGDLASNHLSWQWVAGTFSSKKYYANQNNINRYFYTSQRNTFLDREYDQFPEMAIPPELAKTTSFHLEWQLPKVKQTSLGMDKTTLLYNYYNLDPFWHRNEDMQRVLLFEPSFFREHPVGPKCMDFVMKLSENIAGIQVFVGEYQELLQIIPEEKLVFKEHPTNRHYRGTEEQRAWLTPIRGYFPSFFPFWKKNKKELMLIANHEKGD